MSNAKEASASPQRDSCLRAPGPQGHRRARACPGGARVHLREGGREVA